MSELPITNNQSPITGSSHQSRSSARTTFLPLLFLILAAIASLAAVAVFKNTLYYAHVDISVPGDIDMTFLFNGRGDKKSCERLATNVTNNMLAVCPTCEVKAKQCLDSLKPEQRRMLSERPLEVPSARLHDGVSTYRALKPDAALAACQESERQTASNIASSRMVCFPANSIRPLPSSQKQAIDATRAAFDLLFLAICGLAAGLIIFLVIVRGAQTRPSQTANVLIGTYKIPCIEHHSWVEKLSLVAVDAIVLLGTFTAIAWPSSENAMGWTQLERNNVAAYAALVLLTVGWFWLLLEHYGRRRPFWDELREIFRVLTGMFLLASAIVFFAGFETARVPHFMVWAFNFVFLPLGRIGTRYMLNRLDLWQRPTVIVGTGENAREAFLALKGEIGMGYQILAFVAPNASDVPADREVQIGEARFPVIHAPQNLELVLKNIGNPQIIVALESLNIQANQTFVQNLAAAHRDIHVIPSIRGLPLFGTQLSYFFSHEVLLLTIRNNLSRRSYRWVKRAFDLIVVSVLLILFSPLFLVLAFLIRRTGGPAIYGHARIGRHGKPFTCLKFRSMHADADKILKNLLDSDLAARAEWEKDFKLRKDPRIIPIGHFLRKTSLDELPQLINVLRGEMSLVGPRPIVQEELARYGAHANLYLLVRPGMTGLWQVSGRNNTTYTNRVQLDSWYIRNWSLWYDIAILFKTFRVVVQPNGAY